MRITAPAHFISALHNALTRDEPGPPQPAAGAILREALADGWVTAMQIEGLLIATDPRLWQVTTRELLRVFGIPMQDVFERPTRGARDAEGLPRVSAVDLARLLVLLERSGLSIDAGPICQALAPGLGAKRLLTASELIVYWRAQGRSDEPLTFSANTGEIGCASTIGTNAAGYEARGFYESDPESDHGETRDDVVMLIISPPVAAKHRPAKVRSTAARRHLRKYFGEPRSGKSPRRPARSPAA